MPRLTLIMPARNAQATIARAVTSTLRAMPRDSALWVLDDASDDCTADVLARVKDRRVSVARSTTPLGVSAALNRLLSQVDSDYVGRMDADDVCMPWRLRYELRAVAGGWCDVAFTTVVSFSAGPSTVRPNAPTPISPEALPLHLLIANPVAHSTMLARASHLNEAQGYSSAVAEDYDLWLRLCTAGSRLGRLAVPGIAYRRHPGQATAAADWRDRTTGDPILCASYDGLCEQILGLAPTWYDALRARVHGAPKDADADLAHFWDLLERRSADLGLADRALLRSKRDRLIGRRPRL